MGRDDEFENRYMARFHAMLTEHGLIIDYPRDRAGIDTGLHLFARGWRSTTGGKEVPYWRPLPSRVWFQLKGKQSRTMSAEQLTKSGQVPVSVEVEHLEYWYASPEVVYLVVYVEAVDTFFGVDVRDLVDARWGSEFYSAMKQHDGSTITVHVPADEALTAERLARLVDHRSMRIDGPAFRGRPLGHRLDPLRTVMAPPAPDTWVQLVDRLLAAHDFRESKRATVGDLVILHGVLAQTLLWQSPAFAEYGYSRDPSDVRQEPAPEQLVGPVCLILDTADSRTRFTEVEEEAVRAVADAAGPNGLALAILFRANDLSATGGLWRSTLNDTAAVRHEPLWHQLGLEALSYLALVSTLVYLDFGPDINWDHANYLA